MSDMNEQIQKAIQAAIAEQIVGALDGPQREAILVRSITEVLSGWEFRRAVEKLIHDRATKKAKEVLESGSFDKQIADSITAGIGDVLGRLQQAARQTLTDALCGRVKEGNYDNEKVGLMLKYLQAKP